LREPDVQNGGTITIGNNLTFGGANVIKINKTGRRRRSDLINGISTLTYGGVC
jgi:hypothetical protein